MAVEGKHTPDIDSFQELLGDLKKSLHKWKNFGENLGNTMIMRGGNFRGD